MQFRELNKGETFAQMEEKILTLWDRDSSFEKCVKKEGKPFSFYDGPPFATGLPHYGHLLAGTIKDIVPRYWTMKGCNVPRRFGWDCHGLPIESIIQNQLNLAGVDEIQNYGIDKFNEACRGAVLKYTGEWRKTVRRMGRWVDFDRDYKTMDTDFMESVWNVFKQCWDKGLIYKGYRVQPYSPSLATPLSNFETNQGYKDRQDPSITLLFPLTERKGESILVWTTTPWRFKRGKPSPRSNRPFAHHRKQWAFYATPSCPDLMANRAYAIRPYIHTSPQNMANIVKFPLHFR